MLLDIGFGDGRERSAELGEVGVAAVVAGLGDQGFGLVEVVEGLGAVGGEEVAGHGEVVVGEVESHAGAGGDLEDFLEVVGGSSGEEGAREKVEWAGAADVFYSLVEVGDGFGGAGWVGSAKGEMVEADIEEPAVVLGYPQVLGGATEDFSRLALGE